MALKTKKGSSLLTMSGKTTVPSQIFTCFKHPRQTKARTHGRLCRAPAVSGGRRCCNHQTGEGLQVYNPVNHLPGPPSSLAVAKRTGNLTCNVMLHTAGQAHLADFP